MKNYFSILFWILATLLMSLIFVSGTKFYPIALLISITTIPVVIITKMLWQSISFRDKKKGVISTIYLALIALLSEYLVLILINFYLFNLGLGQEAEMIFNPLFIWFMIIFLITAEQLIESWLFPKGESSFPELIEFISDRKKITVETLSILYIESCNNEVWVRMSGGNSHRTKMVISQWENVLDERFIRIHRSFIVNKLKITGSDSRYVYIGEERIEISRKYKDKLLDSITGK